MPQVSGARLLWRHWRWCNCRLLEHECGVFHDNNSGAWLARRAWHARSTIFVARLALQASVREARPVSRVRRSVPASPTANHALSKNSLHSCRSFWSWITFCFRGRWIAWRDMEQRRRSRFRLAVACVVARPSLLLRHAASSMLKQRWWIKCALVCTGNSFTLSNRSREKKTLLAIRALSTNTQLTVDFVLDRTRKLTFALAFQVSWCAMHVEEVRLWSRVSPSGEFGRRPRKASIFRGVGMSATAVDEQYNAVLRGHSLLEHGDDGQRGIVRVLPLLVGHVSWTLSVLHVPFLDTCWRTSSTRGQIEL